MNNFFEITGDDIALLDDADLRSLIGLLCECDFRSANLNTSGITWGGHQDATDGGLDVCIRGDIIPPPNSYIPRNNTGIQVKKPDMPASEIIKEMMPKGELRESIKELIKVKGAYIIACSSGSTADSALKRRVNAIREAIKDEPGHKDLAVDFYDRNRIASWARCHSSTVLWVREKIGRKLRGWKPYGNWSNSPGGEEEEYLVDDQFRLHDGTKPSDIGLSVVDGIDKLRSDLTVIGSSVRLAGLSGVGKTRLVQALFDSRVGHHALNPTYAYYTDMSDSPDPDPRSMAEQLIANKSRSILIVDNCPPDLHKRLTETCSAQNSTISLLSVEYDVREDLPQETKVLRLEPASQKIIQKIIASRFKHISQVDARQIAHFSGGNARIAIALAHTVEHGETLGNLKDGELFNRLFQQREEASESLLLSAEVCSLVYSFEGTETSSEESELNILASLINKSAGDLYRDVQALRARDLIQSRHVWRALLPHAIANRLAKRALDSTPRDSVVETFLHCNNSRLLKSFTRRLSYLHDSVVAAQIAEEWLSPKGWLGQSKGFFNDLGIDAFRNIAPIVPEKTLDAIERFAKEDTEEKFTTRKNSHYYDFCRILKHLAHDSQFFERSVALLCEFALSESPDENNNSTRDTLQSLFYICLSGTHAPISNRSMVIKNLFDSDNADRHNLALTLLDAALEAWHFSSVQEFEFGARSRDYGWQPKSRKEVMQWYETFIDICLEIALSEHPSNASAKKVLANNLRGLWKQGEMFDAIEKAVQQLHLNGGWREGWLAIKGIMRLDSKDLESDLKDKLKTFEALLRPNDLIERVRVFALSDQRAAFDISDDYDEEESVLSGYERAQNAAYEVGVELAKDQVVLAELMSDIFLTENVRTFYLGQGLSKGCVDRKVMWKTLYDGFCLSDPEERTIRVLSGVLFECAQNAPDVYNSLLDELVVDENLAEFFPIFQSISNIDEQGVQRLHRALKEAKAPIYQYQYIAYGRVHESISDQDLAGLLDAMLSVDEGIDTVLEIISMRFHGSTDKKKSEYLLNLSRKMLTQYDFSERRRRHNNNDCKLGKLAKSCLNGEEGEPFAKAMLKKITDAISDCTIYAFDYPKLLESLAKAQPIIFLDSMLTNESIVKYNRKRIISDDFERSKNPINCIPDETLISWCEKDPETRYELLSDRITAIYTDDHKSKLDWRPVIREILHRAPKKEKILENLADSICPTFWSGSRADIIQSRICLFENLTQHDNPEIRAWAAKQIIELRERVRSEREWEDKRNKESYETFE